MAIADVIGLPRTWRKYAMALRPSQRAAWPALQSTVIRQSCCALFLLHDRTTGDLADPPRSRSDEAAWFSLSHKGLDVSYCEIRALGSVGRCHDQRRPGHDRRAECSNLAMRDTFGFVRQAGLCMMAGLNKDPHLPRVVISRILAGAG
jgi:hypothetical protein